MGAAKITGVCRLGTQPELKFTPSGAAVCSARAIFQDRYQDRQTGEWRDGKALWVNLTAWRQLAENMAESFNKGDDVIIHDATLEVREYEKREGGTGYSVELTVREMGPSIRFNAAKSSRVDRQYDGPAAGPVTDPWTGEPAREQRPPSNQPPAARPGQWSNGQSTTQAAEQWPDKPPF